MLKISEVNSINCKRHQCVFRLWRSGLFISILWLSTRLTNQPMLNKEINCSFTIKSLAGFPKQPNVGQYPYVKVIFY